jgi:trk system potassium uptake protein TrkA
MSKKQKYVLIGMGAFGIEIARTLLAHNEDILVMDKNENTINKLKKEGFDFAVQLNATDEGTLSRFINPEDIVILAMGESFEDNILIVGILKEMGIKKIYARATTEIQMKILDRLGITETLFPEKQEGKRLALRLLFDDFKFIDEFTKDIFIGEIDVPETFCDKTIIEIDLRKNYKINAIGIKHKITEKDGKITEQLIQIGFEAIKLNKSHSLIVVGLEKNIRNLIESTE